MENRLLIFSGPSGSGKTTIVHHLLKVFPDLVFSVSATTRSRRPNEKEGRDYHFLAEEDFLSRIKNHAFVEWEEVYEGVYYGTLKSEIEKIFSMGKIPVFDIDVKGGLNIRKKYSSSALAVIVVPPSLEVLQQRLKKRSTETHDSFKRRVSKAGEELSYAGQFDRVLMNTNLTVSLQEAEEIVREFLGRANK